MTHAVDESDPRMQALRRAMEYWVIHWDWECPTLFGLEQCELKGVLASWPLVTSHTEANASLAAVGSLRELLHGASAVAKAAVPAVCGLPFEQAVALLAEMLAGAELNQPTVVEITGWTVNLLKVLHTKTLQQHAALPFARAKAVTDSVLARHPVAIHLHTQLAAEALALRLRELGTSAHTRASAQHET